MKSIKKSSVVILTISLFLVSPLKALSSAQIDKLIGGLGGGGGGITTLYNIKKRLTDKAGQLRAKFDEEINDIINAAGAKTEEAMENALETVGKQVEEAINSAMAKATTKFESQSQLLESIDRPTVAEVFEDPTKFVTQKASQALAEQADATTEFVGVYQEGAEVSQEAAGEAVTNLVKAEEGIPADEKVTSDLVSKFLNRARILGRKWTSKISQAGGDEAFLESEAAQAELDAGLEEEFGALL